MLLDAAWLGFMVCMICLILKRIRFHNTPTPLYVNMVWLATFTTLHVVFTGVKGDHWGELVLNLVFIYLGFGCYLHYCGDIGYYKSKYLKPHTELGRAYAAEDDPNWPVK